MGAAPEREDIEIYRAGAGRDIQVSLDAAAVDPNLVVGASLDALRRHAAGGAGRAAGAADDALGEVDTTSNDANVSVGFGEFQKKSSTDAGPNPASGDVVFEKLPGSEQPVPKGARG